MRDELRADANFDQALEAAKTFIVDNEEMAMFMVRTWSKCAKSHDNAALFVNAMRKSDDDVANQAAYLVCCFASLGATLALGRLAGRDI